MVVWQPFPFLFSEPEWTYGERLWTWSERLCERIDNNIVENGVRPLAIYNPKTLNMAWKVQQMIMNAGCMRLVWFTDHRMGSRWTGLGQSVPTRWALIAQRVGNECPKNGTELGQYAAWTKKIGLAWYASAIFVEKWHFYDTSMTLLWYFSAQKARSIIACILLSIIVLHCSILQSMILWHFFSKKHFTWVIQKEVIAHIIG